MHHIFILFSNFYFLVQFLKLGTGSNSLLWVTEGPSDHPDSSLFDYMYITTSFQHRCRWMTHCSICSFWTNNHTDDQLTSAYQLWGSLLISDVCIVNDSEKLAWVSPFPMLAISQPCDYNLNTAEKVPNTLALRCVFSVYTGTVQRFFRSTF